MCAGTLINHEVILTAAHCLNSIDANLIEIRSGIRTQYIRDVTSIVIHEEFDAKLLHNDIALAFLSSPISLSDTISKICIPPVNINFEDEYCYVSDKTCRRSTNIGVPILPAIKCQESLQKTIYGPTFLLHSSFICAGGNYGNNVCSGQDGSPLMCSIVGTQDYYLAGIVSWGGCGIMGRPAVLTNVAVFQSWIDQQISDKVKVY